MNSQSARFPPSRGGGGGGGGRFSRGRGEAPLSSSSGRTHSRPSSNNPNHGNDEKTSENKRETSAIPSSGVPYGHVPSYLPGSASLVEQLDKRLMIVLRDGRHLVGILRSFDQFSNMVFEDTSERRILVAKKKKKTKSTRRSGSNHNFKDEKSVCYYTDIELGLYLIRGDTTVLMGEVDDSEPISEKDDEMNPSEKNSNMIKVTLEEFEILQEKLSKDDDESDNVLETLIWDFDSDLVV